MVAFGLECERGVTWSLRVRRAILDLSEKTKNRKDKLAVKSGDGKW